MAVHEGPAGHQENHRPGNDSYAVLREERDGCGHDSDEESTGADLPERLHAIYAARTEDRLLYLKADRDLEYGTLQEAVTVASRAGVRVVGMVAESPPSPPATNARR